MFRYDEKIVSSLSRWRRLKATWAYTINPVALQSQAHWQLISLPDWNYQRMITCECHGIRFSNAIISSNETRNAKMRFHVALITLLHSIDVKLLIQLFDFKILVVENRKCLISNPLSTKQSIKSIRHQTLQYAMCKNCVNATLLNNHKWSKLFYQSFFFSFSHFLFYFSAICLRRQLTNCRNIYQNNRYIRIL